MCNFPMIRSLRRRSVGWSVRHNVGKLHFHALIGALVIFVQCRKRQNFEVL